MMSEEGEMNQTQELHSERVFELLTELSIDPFKQEALRREPEAVLARAGISEPERRMMDRWLQADAAGLQRRSSAFFADPGDDPTPDPDPLPEQPSELGV